MRILYLHQYFNTRDMPGGTRSFEMARRLVAKGHDVHVVTSQRDGCPDARGETVEAGIRVSWLRVPYSNAMGYGRRMSAFADFAIRSAMTAMASRPDVILATSTPLTIAIPGMAACSWHRIPMVFEVRDLWPEAAIQMGALNHRAMIAGARWLERLAYRQSAEIIALSPGMRDGIVATGVHPDRVTVIPNSSDVDLFSPTVDGTAIRQQLGLSGRILAYFGSMGPMHGVGFIVDAAAEFQRRRITDVTFVLCGDGKERPALERRVQSEALSNVRFVGPLAKRDVAHIAAAADVCIATMANVPVIYTSSPNKLFDSLAAGRPVVTNMPGWQREIVETNECGVFVKPDDAVDFADRVLELLASPERLARYGRNARRTAETQFSRDVLADQLEGVLLRAYAPQVDVRAASDAPVVVVTPS